MVLCVIKAVKEVTIVFNKEVTIMMRMVIDNISGNEVSIGVAGCDDDVILIMIEMVVGLTLKKVIVIFIAAMI